MKLLAPRGDAGAARGPRSGGVRGDVVSALVNLGYKDAQAEAAARSVALERVGARTRRSRCCLREALKTLRTGEGTPRFAARNFSTPFATDTRLGLMARDQEGLDGRPDGAREQRAARRAPSSRRP